MSKKAKDVSKGKLKDFLDTINRGAKPATIKLIIRQARALGASAAEAKRRHAANEALAAEVIRQAERALTAERIK